MTREAGLTVNFKGFYNNGEQEQVVDKRVFSYENQDKDIDIVIVRKANAENQQLEMEITINRNGNMRKITCSKI